VPVEAKRISHRPIAASPVSLRQHRSPRDGKEQCARPQREVISVFAQNRRSAGRDSPTGRSPLSFGQVSPCCGAQKNAPVFSAPPRKAPALPPNAPYPSRPFRVKASSTALRVNRKCQRIAVARRWPFPGRSKQLGGDRGPGRALGSYRARVVREGPATTVHRKRVKVGAAPSRYYPPASAPTQTST